MFCKNMHINNTVIILPIYNKVYYGALYVSKRHYKILNAKSIFNKYYFT